MQNKSFTILTTTINTPTLLRAYAQDAVRFRRRLDAFIVAGDRKTPADVPAFCRQLEDDFGIKCVYLGEREQTEYLSGFPALRDYLPWNSVQRRNVALLQAYQGASDIVITIDDDNFPCQPDYLGGHAHVGETQPTEVVASASGWWNICEMLQEARTIPFFARGFPLSARWKSDAEFKVSAMVNAKTVVNAGLWLEDPDIDALTRLCFPVRATGPGPLFRERVACDVGTMSPFNSQNTAILRETLPAYFLFPYVGRYDDIWAGYVFRRIADHFADLVTFGGPLVRQKRNEHSIFKDFDAERFGLEYNDVFLEALASCRLKGSTYAAALAEIAAQFTDEIGRACGARGIDAALFARVAEGLRVWTETIALADASAGVGGRQR